MPRSGSTEARRCNAKLVRFAHRLLSGFRQMQSTLAWRPLLTRLACPKIYSLDRAERDDQWLTVEPTCVYAKTET